MTIVEQPEDRSVLRRAAVPLVAGLVAIFLVASVVALVGDLPAIEWQVSVPWLVASWLLFVCGQGVHAELWRRLLRSAGGRVDELDGQRIFALSLLARYVPTQILLAVTRMRMAHGLGVARTVTLASLTYEIVLVLGTSTALSAGFLLARPELDGSPLRWLVVVAPLGAFVLLHPRVVDVVAGRLAKQLGEPAEHSSIAWGKLVGFAVLYALSFLLFGLAVWAFARGIADVGGLTWDVLTAYAVGYVASILAFFVPGGLGARDAATAAALSGVMPVSVALAVSIGTRLLQTSVELSWAGGTAVLERRRAARAS